MSKHFNYVMQNFNYEGNIVDWLYCIKNFFGDEQTEEFCKYFIHAHQIMRKNDIRNLIEHHSLSVYECSNKEQIAVVTVYVPIDSSKNLIKNIGLKEVQAFYRDKSIKLAQKIRKLGYSYSKTWCNWKDKNIKDTYQREYVFFIYSEKDDVEQFKNNIFKLVKQYNINSVLITDPLQDKSPTLKIKSKLYDVKTEDVIQEFKDTTIETIEKYLSEISNTKVLFKIPYEKNKKVLYLEDKTIYDYYSKEKQELIKKIQVHSFNSGMLKQALVTRFSNKNYNN
jgi:hypothetical protein